MKNTFQYLKKGFTLLEMLLVVAIIAILATIVVIAINPTKQLGAGNDAKRWSDVNTIVNAVYQYAIDHGGTLPNSANIVTTAACGADPSSELCTTGGICTGLTDLPALTNNGTYISAIPVDPIGPASSHTGYFIVASTTTGRVTVCAPDAATGTTTISVTK